MYIIVVGSGIAGLIAALELTQAHQVTLVTKSALHETNTRYAQGGIAAVMHPDDNIAEHIETPSAPAPASAAPKPSASSAQKTPTASATSSASASASTSTTASSPKTEKPRPRFHAEAKTRPWQRE